MRQENLWIINRFGEKLEALLRKPDKSGKFPSILFVAGLGMDLHERNNSFDEISKLLVNNSFLTLQFSFAGCGKSAGDYSQMTFLRQAKQIEDVVNWLVKQIEVNKNKVGLIAQSCGVPSTMLANLINVKSTLFISGTYNTYANLKRKFIERQAYNPTGISCLPRSSGKFTYHNPGFWQHLKIYNEQTRAQKLHLPVFIINGDKDTYVFPYEAQQVYDWIQDRRKKIKIFKDGDHGIVDVSNKIRQEFLQDITQWFQMTL